MWADLLRLLEGTAASPSAVPVLLLAAHPDDETIGAGARLPRLPGLRIVHVTDGAPVDRRWWGDQAVGSREAYARLRRDELRAALALAGVGDDRVHSLGVGDQRASEELTALALRVRRLLEAWRPGLMLTHPYEGGHPDHDACAFAVHAACRSLRSRGTEAPRIVEFTGYHATAEGGLATGGFLDPERGPIATIVLTPEERALKRAMLDAFVSQRATLSPFGVEAERFRPAPAYDFGRAPHEGLLNYERFHWGVTGAEWRERAGAALAGLGLAAGTFAGTPLA